MLKSRYGILVILWQGGCQRLASFDAAFLQRVGQLLIFLHEWLDITPTTILKILTAVKLVLGLYQLFGIYPRLPRSLHGLHNPMQIFLGLGWLTICALDWSQAERASRQPYYVAWARALGWGCFVGSPLIPICGVFFLERCVWDAPKPPSARGRKRKEFLIKLRFRQFEPVPHTNARQAQSEEWHRVRHLLVQEMDRMIVETYTATFHHPEPTREQKLAERWNAVRESQWLRANIDKIFAEIHTKAAEVPNAT